MTPLTFYFDFSSPYAYLASHRVDVVAEKHGRSVQWKPFVLGFILQKTGGRPVIDVPLKGDYLQHDIKRSASEYDIPVRIPVDFPFNSMAAVRAFYWLESQAPQRAKAFAQALFRVAYTENQSIASAESVASIAEASGIDRDSLLTALQDPAVKGKVKAVTTEAIEDGVCGSPFFMIDGQGFWGQDRLEQIDRWLARSGWSIA